MSAGEGDLFGRWSRRKQAVREAEEAERAAGAEATGAETDREVPAPEPGDPAEPLPSLDELTAEGDLSRFLREGVPRALRNAAMRKMWSLDPAIRDHVGLSENAWDFNQPGAMPGFGPLEAGRAVVNFLSVVGREAPADPEAAPAAADAPAVAPDEVASLPPDEPQEPRGVPDGPPAGATAAIEPAEANGSGDPCPEPQRPRHGGAVPR